MAHEEVDGGCRSRLLQTALPLHAFAAAVRVGHSQWLVHGGEGEDGSIFRVYDLYCNVWSEANIGKRFLVWDHLCFIPTLIRRLARHRSHRPPFLSRLRRTLGRGEGEGEG